NPGADGVEGPAVEDLHQLLANFCLPRYPQPVILQRVEYAVRRMRDEGRGMRVRRGSFILPPSAFILALAPRTSPLVPGDILAERTIEVIQHPAPARVRGAHDLQRAGRAAVQKFTLALLVRLLMHRQLALEKFLQSFHHADLVLER